MKEEKVLFNASLGFLLREDKILLAKKAKKIGAGRLNGYGGGIDGDETPQESMVRELKEEAGVITSESSLEKVSIIDFHNTKSDGQTFVCRVHIFFINEWIGEPKESEEMLNPTWFDIKNLPFDEMMPNDKDWLPQALAGKKIIAKAYLGPFQKESLANMEIEVVESFSDNFCPPNPSVAIS
ncbi:MAG: NUDIX domain-containing protein [Candidatus Moraniibacteriota bacterium]